jgi:Ctf8
VKLKQPMLVVEKLKRARDNDDAEGEQGTDDGSSQPSKLQIVGIAKKKILFKTRPKPRAAAGI